MFYFPHFPVYRFTIGSIDKGNIIEILARIELDG